MTDKEWKELCEWAKNRSNKLTVSDDYITFSDDYGELVFDKFGSIFSGSSIITFCRTAKQIKAIIENLL